jgi:hypothetical protein
MQRELDKNQARFRVKPGMTCHRELDQARNDI